MRIINITALYPATEPAGAVHVSEEFFRFPEAEANKIIVKDNDPESLHLEIFGEPAPDKYYVPVDVYNAIRKECDDELKSIIQGLY